MRPGIRSFLALALVLAAAAPVAAELYRCEGADGRAVFTDQKSACPGAEAYEPVGRVTSAGKSEEASPAPAAPAARGLTSPETSAEEILKRQWQQKKLEAEQAVQQVRDRRDQLQPLVSHCNRGGWVTARDDAGIKQRVNCSELKREFAGLEEAEAQARDYLDEGLAEDCRRAGCLPGWIR